MRRVCPERRFDLREGLETRPDGERRALTKAAKTLVVEDANTWSSQPLAEFGVAGAHEWVYGHGMC